MATLIEQIARNTRGWKNQGFPHDNFPVISEILEWAALPDGSGFQLRAPQLRALETYWYLRLVADTPRIFDLYQKYFPAKEDPDALLKALAIPDAAFKAAKYNFSALWQNISAND